MTELEQILELARWAPSGDNTQPWRFVMRDEEHVAIAAWDEADHDVYDYAGRGSLLAIGMLLESLRLAASRHGRGFSWAYAGQRHEHAIEVALPCDRSVRPSTLADVLRVRSVDRRRYRLRALSAAHKEGLAASLGSELRVEWHESLRARFRVARLVARSTDIRLRIPEAYVVHRRVLDWRNARSATRVPVATLGLDPLTLRLMRWMMRDWSRFDAMNRRFGTGLAQLQLDIIPGLASAAYFVIGLADDGEPSVERILRAGMRLQRFWLTATELGLALQPTFAPLVFAHYGRHGMPFTVDARARQRAAELSHALDRFVVGPCADGLVYMGRIGVPRAPKHARSLRLPLSKLVLTSSAGTT